MKPEKDIRKLNDLIAELEDDGDKFRRKLSSIPEDIENKNISSYLEFLAFSTKEKASYFYPTDIQGFPHGVFPHVGWNQVSRGINTEIAWDKYIYIKTFKLSL